MAPELVAAGIDLLRVEVPIGRELADRLTDAGVEVPRVAPQRARGSIRDQGPEPSPSRPAPTGSQRALSELRRALDQAAAERRAYVRLATGAPALWAPESAVVAAFERIDLVESDPMSEIVVDGVDPDRALADHAFAHRLHGRAGTMVVIGAGPLVVGPDLRAGVPSDAATRSGRALALQAISVALARAAGVPASQIVAGAMPAWITDEPSPAARSIAEVVVRRALFPDLALGIAEPSGPHADEPGALARWPHILAAVVARGGEMAVVLRLASRDPGALARQTRAGISVASEVSGAIAPAPLDGLALGTPAACWSWRRRPWSDSPTEAGPRSVAIPRPPHRAARSGRMRSPTAPRASIRSKRPWAAAPERREGVGRRSVRPVSRAEPSRERASSFGQMLVGPAAD